MSAYLNLTTSGHRIDGFPSGNHKEGCNRERENSQFGAGHAGRWRVPTTIEEFVYARGKIGEPITFTFFYTSRMMLEMKKVVPEIPAPMLPRIARDTATNTHSSTLPVSKKRPTREKVVVLLDDCDDEEQLPRKKVKAEPTEDSSFQTVEQHATPATIKMEPGAAPGISKSSESRTTPTSSADSKQRAWEKERAMIRLELDEIKLKKRLMQLDAEHDE